jgi:glycosyltransferase involved in cell wall biosynthesis
MNKDGKIPKVLFLSHNAPEPANAGDTLRLRNLLRFFKNQGYETICIFKGNFDKQAVVSDSKDLIDYVYFSSDYSNLFTKLNKPFKLLKMIQHNNAKAYFADLHLRLAVKEVYAIHKPDVVVAEYIFMAPYLKNVPKKVLKIIDTIDVFARKAEEVCKHGVEFPLACTKDEERKYLLNGDVLMGIQPLETELLKNMVPERKVINVGVDMPCNISPNIDNENTGDEENVLIVAGGNPNNVHGVNQFLKDSWRGIYKTDSNVSLRIVGSVCKHISKELVSDGVALAGVVDDLSLEYRNADVVVNPVVAGTGLKIKTIEAMSYGKPIVSTPNGVEGIVVDEHESLPFVIAESNEFADRIIQLLHSDQELSDLKNAVHEYTKKYLSTSYVYKELEYELKQHESN